MCNVHEMNISADCVVNGHVDVELFVVTVF